MSLPFKHGRTHGTTDRIAVSLTFKLFSDTGTVTTGDGKFVFNVPHDLARRRIAKVSAAVSTVSSSGAVTVQIHNLTNAADVLSTVITIDASEYDSYSASQPVIDPDEDYVALSDRLRFDVDSAGTGAKGLSVTLEFSP